MNEHERISQLSALFDGELPTQQAEMVIRRAVKDSAMREQWQRYALIGACLRGEPLAGAGRHDDLAERVRARLAAEADIIAPGALAARASSDARGTNRFFGRGAVGGAIAAAVAVVSIFVVRNMGPATGEAVLVADNALVAETALAGAAVDEPPSYTTPGANTPAANRLVNRQPLAHYVVAHSEQAASTFGFSYDLTEGTEDMTEDEIRARR
jgi:negative regulator of sigma E activity